MFREKIFFDFYFFVWLVQTLTKTFFNSDNGKTFLIQIMINYFLILFLPKNQIGKNKINPINANASRIISYPPF